MIFVRILNNQLYACMTKEIAAEQSGFMKGPDTREHILNIRLLIEKACEYVVSVILYFIDYQKAFGNVQWNKLWAVLIKMGVPQHVEYLIKNLYVNNHNIVCIGVEKSGVFNVRKGVRHKAVFCHL